MTAEGRLTPRELADRAKDHDFVLLGEKHDNPDHHRLQAWIVDVLVALGRRPAIAMEMMDADQAEALSSYRTTLGADAIGLGTAVGWEKRGWPDWSMYAPIAAAAFRAELPILPADLTRAEIRGIGRGAAPLPSGLEGHPRFDAAQTRSLTEELKESHCGHLPEAALPRMLDVQWARDAHMARVMRGAGRPVVLIAGAGHTRNDRAVPWHLRRTAPDRRVLSVAFVEVHPERTAPEAYGPTGLYDAVWFTARVENDDPCEKFRDSLQRLRRP